MKKITTIALVLFVVLFAKPFKTEAQNTIKPWAVGINWQWQDYNVVHRTFSDAMTNARWQGYKFPSSIYIGRALNPSFNLFGQFGYSQLEFERMKDYNPVKDDNIWTADLNLAYKLANGYIMKETSWFDPYVFIGAGATNVEFEGTDKSTYFKANGGLGINLWLTQALGLNIQGAYDYMITPTLDSEFRNDYARFNAGIKLRFGGKDSDGDGIPDKLDLCPNEAGPKELGGCPDSDGDGIADKDDECPNEPGKLEFKGCPDTDGDGIPDKDDECPNEAGLPELNGCPDSDGDGVPDHKDECPNEFGLPEHNGCPDSDGDGIPDHLDECPDLRGPKSTKGCPDTDGDGIPDKDDDCPTVPGTAANRGCPEEVEEPKPSVEIFKVVYFNTNGSVVMSKYTKDLNEVADLMKEYSDVKVSVAGHADSRGDEGYNMRLSEKRADYVINYLVKKGIEKERLVKSFHGITQPAAPNDGPANWAKNRRVELKSVL